MNWKLKLGSGDGYDLMKNTVENIFTGAQTKTLVTETQGKLLFIFIIAVWVPVVEIISSGSWGPVAFVAAPTAPNSWFSTNN